MSSHILTGRVYDELLPADGYRVLVDRLWPRGIRKDDPRVHDWKPSAAPSAELRRWYDHRPERFAEFCNRYEQELSTVQESIAAVDELRKLAKAGILTLTTATREIGISHVPTLAKVVARNG